MRAPLTVAAVQPLCTAADAVANGRAAQARLVVFPELSLTGYEWTHAVSLDDDAQTSVMQACTATGSIALLGARSTAREDATVSRRCA